MKKFGLFLREYLGHAGAYFMFTFLVFGVVSLSLGEQTNPLKLNLIWTVLLFSLLCALSDLIFRVNALGYGAKIVLHGVFVTASFAVSFLLLSGMVERGRTAMFGMLLFALLYLVVAGIRCVFHCVVEKRNNAKKGYTSLYTPKDLD